MLPVFQVIRQESSLSLQVPMAHGLNKKVTFSQVGRTFWVIFEMALFKIFLAVYLVKEFSLKYSSRLWTESKIQL